MSTRKTADSVSLLILCLITGGAWLVVRLSGTGVNVDRAGPYHALRSLETQITMYSQEWGAYPGSDVARTRYGLVDGSVLDEELDGSIRTVGGSEERKELARDIWNNSFIYVYPGNHDSFDIYSAGEDGIAGTADDVCSWKMHGEDVRYLVGEYVPPNQELRTLFACLFWAFGLMSVVAYYWSLRRQ